MFDFLFESESLFEIWSTQEAFVVKFMRITLMLGKMRKSRMLRKILGSGLRKEIKTKGTRELISSFGTSFLFDCFYCSANVLYISISARKAYIQGMGK